MFSKIWTRNFTRDSSAQVEQLRKALDDADTVILGAGAGLSTAAGFVYGGERFQRYFYDFASKYGFSEMYSGGFYPYASLEERCPHCGKPMSMNLRADETFVEDAGWHDAAERYSEFLRRHVGTKTLFLELGTGYNTPGIIKYPFWRMTAQWENARYACVNLGEAMAPSEIAAKSICLNADATEVLEKLKELSA